MPASMNIGTKMGASSVHSAEPDASRSAGRVQKRLKSTRPPMPPSPVASMALAPEVAMRRPSCDQLNHAIACAAVKMTTMNGTRSLTAAVMCSGICVAFVSVRAPSP